MKSSLYILFVFLVFLGASCKKDTETGVSKTGSYTDYYPLKIGSSHIYLIDSIYYNKFTGETEVYQYQLKETITETFLDESNQTNYRMERYCKFKPTAAVSFDEIPWEFKNVWFVTVTPVSVQRVEENVRFVNLTNPVKDGVTWDGNDFNILNKYNYTYESFGETLLGYANSVKVVQIDLENLIEKQYYEQTFAKGVGLTKHYYIDIESQNITDTSVPIMERIQKGIQFTKVLLEYDIPE
ncbi:MAG: hypothetical protein ACJAZ2_001716 [Glaciecola sp.]|jgi:hypothetical protein